MSASKIVLNVLSACVSILIFLLIVFGVLKLGEGAYDFGYRVFTEQAVDAAPGRDVTVEVASGMSAIELGNTLEEKGLVTNSRLFAVQMKLSAYANSVKPGLYTLSTAQTTREMLRIMSAQQEEEEDLD